MTNGLPPTGTDLQGPLSGMWRSVYRKAAAVAEGRTEALLKEHAYLFHRTVGGGPGHEHGPDAGPWVDEAGDTMSGSLTLPVAVFGPTASPVTAVVFGEPGTGFGPTTDVTSPGTDVGVRFSCPVTATLEAIRWFRVTPVAPTPTVIRLWDTATAAVVLTVAAADLGPWADTALGWKIAPLSAPFILVAGRDYILALSGDGVAVNARETLTTPAPDAPLTWVANILGATGPMPVTTTTSAYGLDPQVGVEPPVYPVARSGAIRLPNAQPGAIAWRNGADTADNTLYADGTDQLLYNGAPLGGGGGGADVTLTTDASLTSTESPANTFALAVRRSAGAGNSLSLAADGLFVPDFLTAGEASAAYLPLTGGTLTGGLTAPTVSLLTTGALTSAIVFGEPGTGFGPTTNTSSPATDYGIRFRSAVAGSLEAVLWYRITTGATAPSVVKLWDTVTSAVVQTVPPSDLAPWATTATGWKRALLSTPVGLVAGRDYILAMGGDGVVLNARETFTSPVAQSPLTWVANILATTGTMPVATTTAAYGLDAEVRAPLPTAAVAGSGVVRLANAANGAIAWRNAGDSADLALTVSSGNALTFDGNPVAVGSFLPLAGGTLTGDLVVSEATPTVSLQLAADTQPRSRLTDTALSFGPGGTTAPDATLSRTSAGALRADTHLGVGKDPNTWQASLRALQLSTGASLWGGSSALGAANATYFDGAYRSLDPANAAVLVDLNNTGLHVSTTNALAAVGAARTFVERLTLAQSGTLTLTPPVGGTGVAFSVATNPALHTTNATALRSDAGQVHPYSDNTHTLGVAAARWTVVYAVAGAINTSSREAKEGITPLDPSRAMEAVRTTEAVTFDYKAPERGPEWYDLPDDPEQAQEVLEDRLRSAPLEAAARHQAGFISEAADPLFLVGEGQTSPGNSVGVLLAALQHLDARITALEGA